MTTTAKKARMRTLTGRGLVALALIVGGMSVLTVQKAQAFGMSDITGVAEDFWEIGADATERVGRKIGKEAAKIGRGTLTSNNKPRKPGRVVSGANSAPPPRGTAETANGGQSSSLPPARRKNERIVVKQKPRPITAEDIKPSHGGKHRGPRDKTVWGNQIGKK